MHCKGNFTFGSEKNKLLTDDAVLTINEADQACTVKATGLLLSGNSSFKFKQLSGTINTYAGRSTNAFTDVNDLSDYSTAGAAFETPATFSAGAFYACGGDCSSEICNSVGAMFKNSVTFEGTSFNAEAGYSAEGNSIGILTTGSVTTTISGGSVSATGGNAANDSLGAYFVNTLEQTGGDFESTSGNVSEPDTSGLGTVGIKALDTIEISDGNLSATSGSLTCEETENYYSIAGMSIDKNLLVKGGNVKITGGKQTIEELYSIGLVGNVSVSSGQVDITTEDDSTGGIGILGIPNVSGGVLNVNVGTTTYGAEAKKAPYSCGVLNMTPSDTIKFSGGETNIECGESQGVNCGLYMYASIEVSNSAILNLVSGNANSNVSNSLATIGSLTLNGGEINIESEGSGEEYALVAYGLNMTSGKISIMLSPDSNTSYATGINTYGTTTLTGGHISVGFNCSEDSTSRNKGIYFNQGQDGEEETVIDGADIDISLGSIYSDSKDSYGLDTDCVFKLNSGNIAITAESSKGNLIGMNTYKASYFNGGTVDISLGDVEGRSEGYRFEGGGNAEFNGTSFNVTTGSSKQFNAAIYISCHSDNNVMFRSGEISAMSGVSTGS